MMMTLKVVWWWWWRVGASSSRVKGGGWCKLLPSGAISNPRLHARNLPRYHHHDYGDLYSDHRYHHWRVIRIIIVPSAKDFRGVVSLMTIDTPRCSRTAQAKNLKRSNHLKQDEQRKPDTFVSSSAPLQLFIIYLVWHLCLKPDHYLLIMITPSPNTNTRTPTTMPSAISPVSCYKQCLIAGLSVPYPWLPANL